MRASKLYAILILMGVCLAALTACVMTSADTPVAPSTSPPTPTSVGPHPTFTLTPRPTLHPYSDFSITVTITATTTELKVGDVVTISLSVTNTGNLYYHRPHGDVEIFLEDGKTRQSPSNPVLEMITPRAVAFDLPAYNLNPGESITAVFVLQAVHPGTVLVRGGSGGEVYLVPDGAATLSGKYSVPLKINVHSSNP